jgi:hypothetical protein
MITPDMAADVHSFNLPHGIDASWLGIIEPLLRLKSQPLEVPHIMIALGRGMENEGRSVGILTAQRAVAMSNYHDQYSPDEVITSGGDGSPLAERTAHDRYSEAMALDVSSGLPAGVVRREEDSRTTLENFLQVATLLDPERPIALLAHRVQMPRALYVGQFVLNRRLHPIIAEDFGASPEPGLFKPALEFALLCKEIALLAGIEPGDTEAIAVRAAQYEDFKVRAAPRIKATPLGRLVLGHLPQYR